MDSRITAATIALAGIASTLITWKTAVAADRTTRPERPFSDASSVRVDAETGRFLAAETIPMLKQRAAEKTPLFPFGAPPIYYLMTGESSVAADGSRARRATPADLSHATVTVGADGVPQVTCGAGQHEHAGAVDAK